MGAVSGATSCPINLDSQAKTVAQRRGQTLAQMALAWALRDRRVTSVLFGASSVQQVEKNIAVLDNLEFSEEELAEIDRYAKEGNLNIWAASSEAA